MNRLRRSFHRLCFSMSVFGLLKKGSEGEEEGN
jgi:hypothetical protein